MYEEFLENLQREYPELEISINNKNRLVARSRKLHIPTMSFPRYVMEQELGRKLLPDEQVHHIDHNWFNNDITNLAIVPFKEHQRMHSQKYYDKVVICPICGQPFLWTAKRQRSFYSDRSRVVKRHILDDPVCSKRCSGIFGRNEQLRRNT